MMQRENPYHFRQIFSTGLLVSALAGCGSVPKNAPPAVAPAPVRPAVPAPAPTPVAKAAANLPVLPPAGSGRGGYYQDDGPGDQPPEGLQAVPDAEPKVEPYSARGNRPYVVFGKTYTPITDNQPLKQRGIGSWYGKKFHGQKTSSGELYDMYKMTAAHPTLPIPSYARVTNLRTGVQVIVRVNDRGPFHSGRIIDLSYTAALKLGYLGKGSSELEVERLLPDEIERIVAASRQGRPAAVSPSGQAALVPSTPTPAAQPVEAALAPVPTAASPPDELSEVLAMFSASRPAAAEPSSPGVAPVMANAGAAGFYLQLGAYGQAGNADSARGRLQQNWASTLPPIELVQSGQVYKLYSGPFTTRAEAADAAQKVQEGGLAKPLIVQR
jgi:rare lipoprotein A